MFSIPRGTQIILWINVAAFLLLGQGGSEFVRLLALWPIGSEATGGPGFYPWQLFTYAFLHASEMHIIFNMFGLVMFGGDIERVWGIRRFLIYYLTCVLSAGVAELVVAHFTHAGNAIVGASGGVFGLLLAYGLLFPRRRVAILLVPTVLALGVFAIEPDLVMWLMIPMMALVLLFPRSKLTVLLLPVPLPAWLLVTLFGVVELLMGLTGAQADVAHFAHLGGMLGGWLLIRYGGRGTA
jgi:membrane associated rhomboid family serine protease